MPEWLKEIVPNKKEMDNISMKRNELCEPRIDIGRLDRTLH